MPLVELAAWPEGHPFAVWLSHDVDQIFDREWFRILADANHLRRVAAGKETGTTSACLRRIARSLFRPAPPERQFEVLRSLERRHGWRSTFFLLEGDRLSRFGARYSLSDRRVRRIVSGLLSEGCEIGVHGGYKDFNSAAGYRRSADEVRRDLGARSRGIRNHFLRWSFPRTWEAQSAAGFSYDSSMAFSSILADRSGLGFPFFTFDSSTGTSSALLELPLLVMDVTVFRYLGLHGESAWEAVQRAAERTASRGGLVSVLWHNNYFAEEEYAEWQEIYEALLARLAARSPWCATGEEIDSWWRARAGIELLEVAELSATRCLYRYRTGEALTGLTLRVSGPEGRRCGPTVEVEGVGATVDRGPESTCVRLDRLEREQAFSLRIEREAEAASTADRLAMPAS